MDGYATGWTVMQRDDRLRNRAELDIRTEHIYIYITRNLDGTPRCRARFARPIIARYRGNSVRCYELYILYSLVCVIEKCISGENVDIVVSNVRRKYAILAGLK